MLTSGTLKRVSIVEAATADLTRLIIEGELAPGEAVTEKDLAESWGISRPSVVAALRETTRQGLLVRNPNHSAQVATFTTKDLMDIQVVRRVVECEALADAFADSENIELGTAAEWRKSIDEVRSLSPSAPTTRRAVLSHEMAFHSRLVDVADSPHAHKAFNTYANAWLAATVQLDVSLDPSVVAYEHERILNTLQKGDTEDYRRQMDTHLARLSEQMAL